MNGLILVTVRTRRARLQPSDFDEALDLLPEKEEPKKRGSTAHLAGSRFNELTNCDDIAVNEGLTLVRTDYNGDKHYHFAGASNDVSLTVYAEDNHAACWSATMNAATGMPMRRPLDAYGFWTYLRFKGDFSLSHANLVANGIPDLDRADGINDATSESALETQRGVLVPTSQVRSRKMKWIWYGHIPAGELSLVAGLEKIGKSLSMLAIVAQATQGQASGDYLQQKLTVVYLSGEDDAETSLKARAIAAGADLHRLYVLHPDSYGFDPERALALNPAWIIFDPISSFLELRPGALEHGEIAIRNALQQFVDMAHRNDVAVTVLRHLKKGEHGANPYDAVLGSKAWTATPRSVIFFAPDPRLPDQPHGLIYPRGNYAAAGEGTRYHLEFEPVLLDDGNTENVPHAVLSLEPAGMTLEDALGSQRRGAEREQVKTWLEGLLQGGLREDEEVTKLAKERNFSDWHLRWAKQELHVKATRAGFGGKVMLRLPGSADLGVAPAPKSEDAHTREGAHTREDA